MLAPEWCVLYTAVLGWPEFRSVLYVCRSFLMFSIAVLQKLRTRFCLNENMLKSCSSLLSAKERNWSKHRQLPSHKL